MEIMKRTLIIGMGEVGKAHFNVLKKAYPGGIFYKDMGEEVYGDDGLVYHPNGKGFDLMLVATQCDPENMGKFIDMVEGYYKQFNPQIIDVLTTTPCGACDILQERIRGAQICRSSIRGTHPHLDKFLYDIPKHIGGPAKDELKAYYEAAGMTCVTHEKPALVEFAHKWNNITYGTMVMITNECAKDARREGLDYMEYLKYRETNNSGFIKAGHPSKVSPILYPSGGGVGGHCVQYAATTIPKEHRGPITQMLADYNNPKS